MTRELQEPAPEQRSDPPYVAGERTMLDTWLDFIETPCCGSARGSPASSWLGAAPRVDAEPPARAQEQIATFQAEVAACREVAARFGLDEVGAVQRRGQDVSCRWIYVHMIEEYARHNGHADLLRERIDGAIGD